MRLRAAPSGLALLVAQRPPSLRLAVVTNFAAAGFICRGVGFGRRPFCRGLHRHGHNGDFGDRVCSHFELPDRFFGQRRVAM